MKRNILINPQMIYYDKDDKPYTPYVKARADITKFLEREGFIIENVAYKHSKFAPLRSLYKIISHIGVLSKIDRGDNVWFEHPEPIFEVFYKFLLRRLRRKGCKIFFITMDLHHLIYEQNIDKDICLLNFSDVTFLHADKMKHLAQQRGAKCGLRCIHFFPYYTEDTMIPEQEMLQMRDIVSFAGSLTNADFLYDFLRTDFQNIKVRFYGFNQNVDLTPYKNKEYMGKFEPSNVSALKSGWGLVWNGVSMHSLEGMLGEYLKYNSPHKMSLYIVAGMPVIAHKDTGLARQIEEKKIGITVNSLLELDEKIGNMSEDEYKEILHNVRTEGEKLRKGGNFIEIVREYINS